MAVDVCRFAGGGERGIGENGAPHERNRSRVVGETERVEAKVESIKLSGLAAL